MLELVQRVVVIDGGRVVLDGPKEQVLAALSGAKPAGAANATSEVRLHPAAQPVEREAAL